MYMSDGARVLTELILQGELPKKSYVVPEGVSLTDGDFESRYELVLDQDVYIVLFFAILLTLGRELLSNVLLKPWARYMGITKPMKLDKIAETTWVSLYHGPMLAWSFAVIANYDVGVPLDRMFATFPQNIRPWEIKLYMIVQEAWYVHMLIVTGLLQHYRTDYVENVIHHLATISLLGVSRYTRFVNISIMILTLTGASDLILHFGKIFIYLQYTLVTNVMFVIFALSFFIGRIVLYPYIIYAWHTYARTCDPSLGAGMYYGGTFGLSVLLVLFILWFKTIVVMVVRTIRAGAVGQDERSDDDK